MDNTSIMDEDDDEDPIYDREKLLQQYKVKKCFTVFAKVREIKFPQNLKNLSTCKIKFPQN